jgi:hypothetical protein
MVYDQRCKRVVLFGGRREEMLSNETWEYDSVDWRKIQTPVAPPPRASFSMAYDSVRGKTVLFGGELDRGKPIRTVSNETWEYDGSTWVLMTPSQQPVGRRGHAMAYDADRNWRARV